MKNSLKIRLITILSTLVLCLTAFLCVNTIKGPTVVFAEENSLVTTQSDATLIESWDISATVDDNVIANLYSIDGGYNLEITGTGNMKDFTYSASDDGWKYAPWYTLYNNGIISVTIGDSITTIGSYAFYYCSSLTKVNYTGTIDSWVQIEFAGDNSNPIYYAKNLYINDMLATEVTLTIATKINSYAFYDCDSIQSIVIGDSVTSIGDSAFYDCDSLTNVEIGDGVTSIGDTVFYDCNSLMYNVKDGLKYLGNSDNRYLYLAGAESKSITTASIDNNCKLIGDDSFAWCTSLTTIKIGNYVQSIGKSAFYFCTSLKSVTIGNNVINIGEYAFFGCKELTNVIIGASVANIDIFAFENCYKLLEIYNLSLLPISKGSEDYGYIGYYAEVIHTTLSEPSILTKDSNGFVTFDDNGVKTLVYYEGTATEITIPNDIKVISKYAFYENDTIKSVVIPDSVESIGESAFFWCISLKSVIIGNGVEIVEDNAFYECSSLESVVIPNSVITIGVEAFSYCSALKSLTIGSSVTSIGEYAFSACVNLTEINFNAVNCADLDSDSSIFSRAGENGEGVVMTIGSGVKRIPSNLCYFGGVSIGSSPTPKVTKVIFDDNSVCESIGKNAFCNCNYLEYVKLGGNLKTIEPYAFANCTALLNIEFNGAEESWNNITKGEGWNSNVPSTEVTFLVVDYAKGLVFTLTDNGTEYSVTGYTGNSTIVKIPSVYNGLLVTSIGEKAFYNCTSLTSVEIPESISSIGSSAFYGCTLLEEIMFNAINCADFNSGSNVFYSAGQSGKGIDVTFGENVKHIPAYLFYSSGWSSYHFPKLASVTIGNNVTSIGDNAFYYSSSLRKVNFLGTIDQWVEIEFASSTANPLNDGSYFYINGVLQTEIITNAKKINAYAFYNCSSLTSVTIGNSVTSIGDSAFYNCYKLINLTIGKSVKRIDSSAFYNCNKLINVNYLGTIDKWVDIEFASSTANPLNDGSYFYINGVLQTEIITNAKKINAYAFYNCTSLTSVVIPNNVTSIGMSAFNGCTSLTSVTIGTSITSIGERAFYNCTSLTSVVIPNSVTSIGTSAFDDCTSLKSVTIGTSVTSIGERAFYNCISLTKIYFNAINCVDVSSYIFAFAGQKSNGITVTFGDKVERIPAFLFSPASDSSYSPKITSVIIGKNVEDVGDYAFRWCEYITSITIGKNIESIGNHAFYGCDSLTKVNYTGTIDSWAQIKFSSYDSNPLSCGASLYINDVLQTEVIINAERINASAFNGCTSLTNVTIGNSVTSIGYRAFYNCTSLTSVEIPDSVTSIGDYAFENCSSLTSIEIPDSVISIGEDAFLGCFSIKYNIKDNVNYLGNSNNKYLVAISMIDKTATTLTIANSCKFIHSSAFKGCISLKSVTIGENVISIGSSAFYNCPIESATIPTIAISYIPKTNLKTAIIIGGESIGDYAFRECNSLTSVVIGNSVTSIGYRAFYNCSLLDSIEITDSLIYIGDDAFYNCTSLKEIFFKGNVNKWVEIEGLGYLPISSSTLYINGEKPTEIILDTARIINNAAFNNCITLTSVVIGENVISIGSSAFYNCSLLTSVVIGENVTSIGSYAFSGCSSLEKVNYLGTIDKWVEIEFGGGVSNPTYWADDLYINDQLVTEVKLTTATKISKDVFYNCKSITKVTIGDNVTSIGEYAFCSCSSLTNVIIGDNVTSIGSYAFRGCSSLTSVMINNGVTSIGNNSFEGCDSLTGIEIPDSVTSIGKDAFLGCFSIKYNIKDNVNYLGNSNNKYLVAISMIDKTATTLTIANSCKFIHSSAFKGCISLKSVTIGENVTSIGIEAFYYCVNLTKINFNAISCTDLTYDNGVFSSAGEDGNGITVVFGEKVNYIPAYLFYSIGYPYGSSVSVPNIKSVVIGDSVEIIGDYAFRYCRSLISITFGKNVISIGDYAFSECNSLTSVAIGNSVKSVGNYAFEYCTSLTNVVIPDSVTSIGIKAFYYCVNLTKINFNATAMNDLNKYNYVFYRAGQNNAGINVTIGANVNKIPAYLFDFIDNSSCQPKIKSVTFEENSVCESIGEYAFYGCNNIEYNKKNGLYYLGTQSNPYFALIKTQTNTIVLDDNCYLIADDALKGRNIEYKQKSDLQYIPSESNDYHYLVGAVSNDITKLEIDANCKAVAHNAFEECNNLNKVIIPNSVVIVGKDAFLNSSANVFYVFKEYNALSEFECVLIDGYGEIESGFNFVKLKDKNDAIVIGDGQLNSNKNIEFLKKDAALLMFDEGITGISGSVFSGNSSLRRIVLSSSVTDLGQGVFTDCSGLLSVYVNADYSYGFNKKLLDSGLEGFTVYYNGKTLGWDEINSYNPDADKEYLYWTNDGSGYTVSEFGEIMYLESIVIDGNTYYRDAQGIIYSNVNGSAKTIDIVGFEDISVSSENIVIPKVIVIGGDNYSIGSITSTAFVSEDSLKIRTISLYGKINQIDSGAFSGCTNLLALYVRGEKPSTIASDIFSSDNSAKRKIAIVVLGDDSAWKNASINNATVYEGEVLDKNKIDRQGIVYTLDVTNGTAIVGTKSNSVGEGDLVNYNGVNTSGSTATDIEIPDFVIYDNEIYMVIGFDRFAFYKSPATSVEFGAFIGVYETANNPAVWECTFREMANIEGFAVDSQNDKYYVDEVGALYGDGFKVKVKVAMVYINDINVNVKLYSRLIKAPSNITEFTVREGTTVIEKYAFSRSNIQSVNLNDVNVIGSHAFYACPYLIKVSGGAVYYIEDSAFESTPIRTFNFENLTHIGERAFYNTDISGSVAIRADVAIIGDNAFSRCENISEFAYKVIETVRFDPETQEEIIEKQEVSDKYPIYSGVLFKSTENGLKLLQYPLAKTDTTYDMSKVDGSIYEISAYAFYGAKHLENIIMSDDTVLVGGYAFADISTLKKATIGQSYYGSTLNEDGLYSIGLFTNSNLSEIVVAEGNRYFKSDASGALYSKDMKVLYCYPAGVERVVYTVPYQTEVIYSNAFFGNTHLVRIIILNEDFKEVGDQAFAQCSNLKEVFFRLENLPNSGVKVFDNDEGVKAKFLKATNNNLPAYWDFAEVETYSVITELGNQTVKTSDYTFVIVDTNGNSMYNARIALYIEGRGYYLSTNEFGIVVFSEADGIFDDGVERLIYVSKDGYFTHKQTFYPDNEMKISYITLSKEPTIMGVSCEGNDINSTVYDLNLAMYGESYFDSETGRTVEGYIKKDVNGNIIGVDETVAKVSEKINISVVAYLDSGVVPTSCSLVQGDKVLQTLENGETSGSQVTYNFWVEYTKFIEDEIIYAQLITKCGEDEKTQKTQLNVNVFNFIITEDQINLNTEDISVDLSGNASILSTLIGSDKLDFSIGKNTKINIVPYGDTVTVTLGSKKEKSKSYNSNKEGYNDNHEAHNKNTYHFKFMGVVKGKEYSFNVRFAKGTEDLGYCYYMLSIYEGYYAKDKVVEKYGVVNGAKGLLGRNAYASKASLIYASYLTSAIAKENIKEGEVYSEAVGSFDENKNLSTKSSFELSLSGSLKFKYDKNEIRLTEGEIKGTISVGFKMQQQYVIWIIPVVLEVDMGVDGTVNLSLRIDKQNAPITIESAKAKIEANLNVSLGVGCSWASIGVYGGVGTVFILEFAPNIGIDEWSINGNVGWYVKALFFEKKGEIWSGNYTIIDDYYWYTWNESGEYGQVSLTSMYLVENYEVEDREKMQEQAKLIVCEGKLYKIFYVDAFNQNSNNYDNYNYRKLAVAEWSGSEWINIKLIDDNGYNDQSYNVYEQNGKLYVAYLQQSEKLIDTTVNDTYYVSENLLLKSAIIDLSNFDVEICKEEITKTSGYKYLQNYAVVNGQQVVVWAENSDNNMFGVSPYNYVDANGNSHVFKTTANSIYTSIFDGNNWSEPILLASGLAPVTSLTISNDGTVVYNLDEDCDLSTLSDRVVYYLDGSEQVKLVQIAENEEIISILVKDGKVFCYCKRIEINGNDITEVYYLEEYNVGANTSVIDVIKHKVNIATDAYQTVYDEDGNLVGIIYIKNNKDNNGTAIYGKFYDCDGWGEEVLIVESIIDYYIAEYSVEVLNDNIYISVDYINGQGEFVQSSVVQREIISDVDIQSSIDYIARKAYIIITNNGLKAANVTCQYCNDIKVLSGCSYVYEISFNDFNSDVEESITITVDGKELSNKVVIPLEYSDLRLVAKEVVLGENRTLIIGVTNDGNVVADAMLYVSAGINGGYLAMTGKTVDVIGIAPGQTKYYNVTVDSSIVKVGETILTLYINVSDGSELGNSIDNNCLYFSLEELEEIDVESMGMVIEPTISESQVNIDKHTEKIEIEYTCDEDASIHDVVYNGSSIFNFVEINEDNKTIVINKQFIDGLGDGAHDIVIVFENSNNEYKTSKIFNVIKNMTVGVEWEIAGETMSFDNVEYGGLTIIPKYIEETSEKYFWFDLNGNKKVEDSEKICFKLEKEGYDYLFVGWDKNEDGKIDPISQTFENIRYVAVFREQTKEYVVTWIFKNASEEDVFVNETYFYGNEPVYKGTIFTPINKSFVGYDKEISTVSSNIVYTAVYEERGSAIIKNTETVSAWDKSFSTTISIEEIANLKNMQIEIVYDALKVELLDYVCYPNVNIISVKGNVITIDVNISDGAMSMTIVDLVFKAKSSIASGMNNYMTITNNPNLSSNMNGVKIYEVGDANMDGNVDVIDLMMIKSASLGKITLTENQKAYANATEDYTEDGGENINVLDMMKIKQFILNKTNTVGERISVDFVGDEQIVEYSMSIVKGTTPEGLPEIEEGYVWSLSQESYEEVDFTKFTINTLIYKIKENYLAS